LVFCGVGITQSRTSAARNLSFLDSYSPSITGKLLSSRRGPYAEAKDGDHSWNPFLEEKISTGH
jgi:hypothetical protein